ncbi:alpha/beta hydrolase [Kitasatospora sp. NPDC098652]|uniref:alpha/beta hydrolase n=1 Tax=Kitasatospora sp. NPDC098652 TaxID=3364095 RepID=UPI0037FE9A9E
MGDDIERSDLMVASANDANKKAGDKATTSSITWVGYDAPQSIVPEAAVDIFARGAEDKLHSFETGLRATHEGKPSNNTILGHSYGTTVVGYTLRDKGLPVDNVVLIASPGAGVEHARDLGVAPSHVFAAQGDIDRIKNAPPESWEGFASNLDNNIGSTLGIVGNPDHHLSFGRDPSVPQFGAQIIPTGPGTDHSAYWNQRSPSLVAMGQIIAGKPI